MSRPRAAIARIAKTVLFRAESILERHVEPSTIPLRAAEDSGTTSVEVYWGRHTVNSNPFRSAGESLRYLVKRSEQYPLFERLMELHADHSRDVVLDYGCGPGNDLVGFAVRGKARRVIGLDVSMRALLLARSRLALHGLDASRVELMQVSDDEPRIPLETGSVDYLYCEGVLHHTTHPEAILAELARVMRADARGHIMVYNRHSLWFNLYTAYVRQIVEGAFSGLSVEDAFQRSTDGEDCPIARAYRPEDFAALCRAAGFRVSYLGGYFAKEELALFQTTLPAALADSRLAVEQQEFLRGLTLDADGYPRYEGNYAGVGGVFRVEKAAQL
jgi:ubiquinone/menaquinone biosynthesis C-methylase UbiE